MAFSLIDDTAGAIPVAVLTKDQFPSWLAEAPERERNWLTAIGFSGEPGKLALVPAADGRLARVVVGLGEGTEPGAGMWALAGLPGALPEGSYRLEIAPDGADPTRLALGWALATYAFTRYRVKKSCGDRSRLARGRRSRPRRAARPRGVPRPRPRQYARRGPRSGRARSRGRARRQGGRRQVIGSSSATICSPRISRRSMPSAGPPRSHRASSTSSGASRPHPR